MGSNVPVPIGYHFKPSSKELVISYLRRWVLQQPLPCPVIREFNVYELHPKDIPGNTPAGKHMYFFTRRKIIHGNGTKIARRTNGGYWKVWGREMIIKDKTRREIGRKKLFVFYEGHQPNERRTGWRTEEYTIKEFWFPTDENNDTLVARALCEIYFKPTLNQLRVGELQIKEEEEEDEGSASDSPVRPHPAPCNDGGKAPIDSTNGGCPSAFGSFTARSEPSMPFMNSNNLQRHNMVLIPPSGNRPGSLVHSFYCPCVVSASSSSSQFGNSAYNNNNNSSFRNQMIPPPPQQHGQFSATTASSSQYQVPPPPPQFCFEASRLIMPSASEISPQTTPWPLPRHLS